MAMIQKMFDAPTHDELMEQELDPLMREALLAVDSEEATRKAFQRVDIKRKYGVKCLREVVERNLEGDTAVGLWVGAHQTRRRGQAPLGTCRAERDMDCAIRIRRQFRCSS